LSHSQLDNNFSVSGGFFAIVTKAICRWSGSDEDPLLHKIAVDGSWLRCLRTHRSSVQPHVLYSCGFSDRYYRRFCVEEKRASQVERERTYTPASVIRNGPGQRFAFRNFHLLYCITPLGERIRTCHGLPIRGKCYVTVRLISAQFGTEYCVRVDMS
jgi:hypothetical protein